MSILYQPYASIAPSRNDSAYIIDLVPTVGNGLAALTSESEVLLVDRQDLSSTQPMAFQGVPAGTSCLTSVDAQGQTLLCAGFNGTVATFDVRSQRRVAHFKIDRAVTALACDAQRIAIGTEFKSQQAIVSLWDVRQNKQTWQNSENNDEITAIDFHPSRQSFLLAGGDDGLISLFDTTIAEEDESLMQVINHGPIHKAGFLGEKRIFALSSDQNLAVHPVSTPGDEQDPEATMLGDVRPLIPCQYVIDVQKSGDDYLVAAGSNLESSRIDLIKLHNAANVLARPTLDSASRHCIEPAHGEEIVRALFADDSAGVIFTAGEDGHIRASRPAAQSSFKGANKPPKHKKGSESRYKPY